MVNEVTLIGRLGAAPEAEQIRNSDHKVCKVSLATTDGYYDKHDKWIEDTAWHNLVAWNKLAERLADMDKGQLVYVKGKIIYRDWEDEKGKHYKTEIECKIIKKLNNKAEEKSRRDSGSSGRERREPTSRNSGYKEPSRSSNSDDDDLPF